MLIQKFNNNDFAHIVVKYNSHDMLNTYDRKDLIRKKNINKMLRYHES